MKNYSIRLIYFIYYLKQIDRHRLLKFMKYVKDKNNISFPIQIISFVYCSFRYNISILEYYQFRFYQLSHSEKSKWAGTGTMYEFQRIANPLIHRNLLEDKRLFYDAYQKFFLHNVYTLTKLQSDPLLCHSCLSSNTDLVFKPATGNCGIGISFVKSSSLTKDNLVQWMLANKFDLVESRLKQHPALDRLSPSGVNTVRVFTCLDKNGFCQFLGCRLRISVNSPVDNMAAGNLAAPVDEVTGVVCGPGVYSDISKPPEHFHPVTGISIEGFQIPYWNETLEMIREASELYPINRSIGWDVVITSEGPGLIEGNHDWCKLVWQLPVARGLKHLLPQNISHD